MAKEVIRKEDITIIIYSVYPFTQRDFHRFGADYLIENGYKVELWECRDKGAKIPEFSSGMYNGDNLYVYTKKEFVRKIKENRKAFYITFSGIESEILLAFAKCRCRHIIYYGISMSPVGKAANREKPSPASRVKAVLKGGIPAIVAPIIAYVRKFYKDKALEWSIRHNPPVCVMCSTHEASKRLPDCFSACRLIYTHVGNYDRYLELEQRKVEKKGNYILYCDAGYGNRFSDAIYFDLKDPIYENREYYWKQMERTLSALEQYYNMPIIIAGHPHAVYEAPSYNGREIIFGKTEELVKNCSVFIMAATTAVGWAILYDKEILMLYDDLFYGHAYWDMIIKPCMDSLGIEPCNMDREEMASQPWKYAKHLDRVTREEFISKFIKEKGTPEKLIVEVIEDIIWQEINSKKNNI